MGREREVEGELCITEKEVELEKERVGKKN